MEVRARLAQVVCLVASTALLSATGSVSGAEVGGGGSKATDCLSTFIAAVNLPASNPRHVRCVDGDPACDCDELVLDSCVAHVNGVCTIQLQVRANSNFSASCMLAGVDTITVEHSVDTPSDPKFDPDFQALQTRIDSEIQPPTADDLQTLATNIRVPIKGPLGANKCGRGKKKVKLVTYSQPVNGKVYRDTDVIKLQCDPNPGPSGCDPQQLFASTYDRIQRQVFNPSCAVSGCHDSTSAVNSGNLLLDNASFTNLVGVDPFNLSAFGAGWKRVHTTAVTPEENLDRSYLYRKLEGGSLLPDPTYGVRMPRNRRKLHSTLRTIVRLWILNGAPASVWVPGTF